jgi:hypothetical protein
MERKNVILGVVIVSVVIAAGLAMLQSREYYQPERGVYVAEESGSVFMKAPEAADLAEEVSEIPAPEQKVIKTSYISLEVESFKRTADEIETIAKKYGGYVSDSSVQDVEDRKIGYVTVRVPEEHFDEVVNNIETVGVLQEENISLEDVTERYIDLKARLENLTRQEQRYLEILAMATTVEDVLKVETQLERIRGDIESLQGTLNYLDNRINFSTIQVRLAEPEKITHESGIGRAFSDAIDAFLSAVRGIIIFLGYFIPIALFLTVIVFVGLFIYRKLSKEH